MIKTEGEKGINPSELRLSKTEVDKQAFGLMTEFKAQLDSLEEFRRASSDVYLNISRDQDKNVDAPHREIEIGIGNSTYRVNYSFSAKEQNLMIIKETLGTFRKEGVYLELMNIIILKSRRFADQRPIGSAKIDWHYPVGDTRLDHMNPQINTAFAVQKAREMLAGLTPQAPQK